MAKDDIKDKQLKHILLPVHTKLTDKEKQEVLDQYKITIAGLPKINKEDPAIAHLDVSVGDVIKIERKSYTTGTSAYYRVVISN